jgi:predicted ribonuclease toxin of YeeF-YezG toxin-antitoxin module
MNQSNQRKNVYLLIEIILIKYQISFLAVVRKIQLFKVQSNSSLEENLAVTKYVKEPFFEDK